MLEFTFIHPKTRQQLPPHERLPTTYDNQWIARLIQVGTQGRENIYYRDPLHGYGVLPEECDVSGTEEGIMINRHMNMVGSR